jgi:hypothetical protein
MKIFRLIALSVFGLVACIAHGQVTKPQADDLVLNQLLQNQLSKVDVYSLPVVRSSQNSIVLFDNSIIELPYSECWVYFVDDLPPANWVHNCRYIFVNSADGNNTIINSQKFPVG